MSRRAVRDATRNVNDSLVPEKRLTADLKMGEDLAEFGSHCRNPFRLARCVRCGERPPNDALLVYTLLICESDALGVLKEDTAEEDVTGLPSWSFDRRCFRVFP